MPVGRSGRLVADEAGRGCRIAIIVTQTGEIQQPDGLAFRFETDRRCGRGGGVVEAVQCGADVGAGDPAFGQRVPQALQKPRSTTFELAKVLGLVD